MEKRAIWYDNFGRIVHETHSGMGVDNTYTYDTFGRLSSVASNGSTRTFAYNSLGRLQSAGNTTFVYDTFGNRISSTTDGMSTNFTYVRGNLLAGVDSNILYEYNKDGARFQKTVDGVVTKFSVFLEQSTILDFDDYEKEYFKLLIEVVKIFITHNL